MHVLLDDRSKRPALGDAWQVYVFPYEHFWFVQALLLIFALIVVLETCAALRTLPRFLCVLGLAMLLSLHPPFAEISVFSIREATYLLPHFLLGLGANRFRSQLQARGVFYCALICFICTQAWHTLTVISTTPPPINTDMNRTLLGLAIGMSATLCALQLVPAINWAAMIGKRSYPIYLYHPIFVAGFRVVVGQVHGVPLLAMFSGCLIAGIAGPLLVSRVSERLPVVPLLLEGKARARTAVSSELRGTGS
jgi:peptidoglycan/LPS O-acetylase OafA/YrhL